MDSFINADLLQGENLTKLIQSVGYIGLFAIVFAESGLLIGFFLPGDSLLFTAGFLAAQGFFNIYWLIAILFTAAVLGDSVGYMFGKKVGPKLFDKEDSLLFHKKHLIHAETFYKQYGPMTIVVARFIPVVRTFAPIVAGIGKMNYRLFVCYNIVGGAIWTFSLTLAGYYLSRVIPNVEENLELIIAVIILLSVMPPIIHILKERRRRK